LSTGGSGTGEAATPEWQSRRDAGLGEVATQCRFALGAVGQLNHAMQQLRGAAGPVSAEHRKFLHDEVFRTLHSFLAHAANAARLLWPAPPPMGMAASEPAHRDHHGPTTRWLDRAESLRSVLRLPAEGHPLADRALLDLLEPFDPPLDDWLEGHPDRIRLPDTIAPRSLLGAIDPSASLRWYDPETHDFYFRGRSFDIQTLAAALDQLLPLASERLDS
jgi:hypothetical protein